MAVFCKIFMNFETRFWGDKDQFYIAAEQKGYYPMFISLPKGTDGKNILFCIVVGNEARRIEQMQT
jgi:monoamine oxidase